MSIATRQLVARRCRRGAGRPQPARPCRRPGTGRAATGSGDRGSVSAETAVVLPALLVLILLVVQTALYAHARNLTQSAAQEGLRAARLRAGSAAAGQTAGTLLTSPTVSAARSLTTATVTVDGHATAVVPFLTLTVHSTAAGPVERFVPAAG